MDIPVQPNSAVIFFAFISTFKRMHLTQFQIKTMFFDLIYAPFNIWPFHLKSLHL